MAARKVKIYVGRKIFAYIYVSVFEGKKGGKDRDTNMDKTQGRKKKNYKKGGVNGI